MQNVKNKLNEYLDNKITIDELNTFFRQEIPFSDDLDIEEIRINADLTVVGELTEQDKADELIDEKTFKIQLREYLNKI